MCISTNDNENILADTRIENRTSEYTIAIYLTKSFENQIS